MKQAHVDTAARLVDERHGLFTLRTAALTNTVTMAAGTCPMEIPNRQALILIDTLIQANASAMKELGITDITEWRMPAKPPEAKNEC